MSDNYRTVEDLVSEEEFEIIFSHLKADREVYADFYYLLRHTGMRMNELLGLSLDDIKLGKIPETKKVLNKLLEDHRIEQRAYIVLRHQPSHADDGRVVFKPLKSKKAINHRTTRYIPISDERALKILAKYVKRLRDYKDHSQAMLFFFEINKNTFHSHLQMAYRQTKFKFKSSHCLRHTRATELARHDLSEALSRLILGHSPQVAQRYNHIVEQLIERAVNNNNSYDAWDEIA